MRNIRKTDAYNKSLSLKPNPFVLQSNAALPAFKTQTILESISILVRDYVYVRCSPESKFEMLDLFLHL